MSRKIIKRSTKFKDKLKEAKDTIGHLHAISQYLNPANQVYGTQPTLEGTSDVSLPVGTISIFDGGLNEDSTCDQGRGSNSSFKEGK